MFVCTLQYSAHNILITACIDTLTCVHLLEGRYVLSAVLHAPEEGKSSVQSNIHLLFNFFHWKKLSMLLDQGSSILVPCFLERFLCTHRTIN